MDRPSKRPRLSMACNICRQRKVKCDAEYPKCRNCRLRNQQCITTDPQRPGVTGIREWLDIPDKQTPQNEDQPQHPAVGDQNHQEATDSPQKLSPNEVSPVHHPFDVSFNVEHGTDKVKIMGGSSSQCLAKSLDVYFKAARLKPVSGCFRYGMRHAEELDLPLSLSLPELPDRDRRERYLSAYISRIHPLYPIFNTTRLRAGTDLFATAGGFTNLPREQIPRIVSAYLIMSLGADEIGQGATVDGDRYLQAAACLLSHVIIIPYLPTVQTLLLFTMVYRGRNQEGLAWQTLGMAIRTAYTLGINRTSTSNSEGKNIERRVWAVCWCLEKMMHLESGRPTVIGYQHPRPEDALGESKFLQWHVELGEYQGNISDHLYSHQSGTRDVRQILLDTARLDRELLSWANRVPSDLRPGSDIFCADEEFHAAAFLSIQYHSTLISLHRAALIAPTLSFEEEVARYCSDEPSQFRMRLGESICVSSARAIAKLSVQLSERKADSQIITAGPSLLACIVLAIFLIKHPGSRLQAMDLQLLKACLEYSSQHLSRYDPDPRFIEGIAAIYEQCNAHLRSWSAAEAKRRPQSRDSLAKLNPLPTPAVDDSLPPWRLTGVMQPSDLHKQSSGGYQSQRVMQSAVSTPAIDHEGHDHLDSLGFSSTSMLDGFVAEGVNVDQVFPFEGYNVEELWNWMGCLDSPGSMPDIR
ncbi:transcriptional regulator family: Fungal Specific TF [Aspergillus niger]|uniref:transcription factor domain-containing protein n=1 Tax=Aspergillus lacticoffeatus (strain CBS 101883) TaxID=1450533 RepID=UPI000D7F36EE|nr:fungal-specific transcription factor domain-containing protein [Aspergillus niger CBS 101883]KAI2848245.1 transcriptional regulator family: Fungal Specific TF [Aspergillus niger]KAI2882996.1 transcriptional regulator family: Fungal Specific TF [Aspergillus niger]KAI2959924.1 transcriptional regulator family: Fungal Specific TF [Aspergillus niger]KAI2963582.1 transcriptional regulator family: Fungal Specific TF [Aspergillus niger]KAI3028806.1 transcriptional regulator family: Fungal Specific